MNRILSTIAVIIGLGLAVWIVGILFVGLVAIAAVGYGIYFARDFLTDKGILNPTPGVAQQDEPERITIIEGDFTRVEDESKQ